MEEQTQNLSSTDVALDREPTRLKHSWWKWVSLLIIGAVFGMAFLYYAEFHLPQNNLNTITVITVQRGDSVRQVGQKLVDAQLIPSAWPFLLYFKLHPSLTSVKAGVYHIAPGLSLAEMLNILSGKNGVNAGNASITLPEGLSLAQIQDKLSKTGFNVSDLNKLHVNQFVNQFSFLQSAPRNATLEGFLFPDTYQFYVDATSTEVAQIMLQNFDKKVPENIRQAITKQNRTLWQVIVMASMLEKEAKKSSDMQIISGILWKRLKLGMPLQVDSTVAYALDKWSSPLTYADLKYNSPYNTYLYYGLPKGPISNPGIQAILAATFPRDTNYLYYLSAPDGTIIYSATLQEQNAAKQNILKTQQ